MVRYVLLNILIACFMAMIVRAPVFAGESGVASDAAAPYRGAIPGEASADVVDWIRDGGHDHGPRWGLRGGLSWGIARPSGKPVDGPRGLIRLRYPVLPGGQDDLLNFIAVEPVVQGRKGFSELEHSTLDNLPGKRFWVDGADAVADDAAALDGQLTPRDAGVECLRVGIRIERFDNGAHVRLDILQRSDRPDEIQLRVHAEPDSAPLEYCILTATMGNKARARQLWLKDRAVSSLDLYADYRAPDFAPHRFFPRDQLHRTAAGDLLVAITTDEADPASVQPFPQRWHWYYGGSPVTQYWKKLAGTSRDDLHVAVNARYTYWLSQQAIPGGVSFENFELRERFYDGQSFVFGITDAPPRAFGFP